MILSYIGFLTRRCFLGQGAVVAVVTVVTNACTSLRRSVFAVVAVVATFAGLRRQQRFLSPCATLTLADPLQILRWLRWRERLPAGFDPQILRR